MLHLGGKKSSTTTTKQKKKKETKPTAKKNFHGEGGEKGKRGESGEIVQNALVLVVFEAHCSTDKG